MNKKHVAMLTVAGLCLALAGCGAQSSPTNSGSSSSSLLASKSSEKMSADNLSPQQMVSVVTTYAGNKYGKDWATTAKAAHKLTLQVDLYNANRYKLDSKGQGVAYNVHAANQSSKLVYTVDGDNVNIFQNAGKESSAKKLGTVSRKTMVNYLNKNGQSAYANQLAKNAQVNDKRNGDNSSSSSSSSSNGKYGNAGVLNVPSDMQGTWYSKDNQITFGQNTIQTYGHSYHIYKQSKAFAENNDNYTNKAIQDATKDWMRGYTFDHDGMHWLNLRTWTQGASDGAYYAVHTETIDGQQVKVLVEAGGAGIWTDEVYYQTQSMAKQNAHRKFDDLRYQDD